MYEVINVKTLLSIVFAGLNLTFLSESNCIDQEEDRVIGGYNCKNNSLQVTFLGDYSSYILVKTCIFLFLMMLIYRPFHCVTIIILYLLYNSFAQIGPQFHNTKS